MEWKSNGNKANATGFSWFSMGFTHEMRRSARRALRFWGARGRRCRPTYVGVFCVSSTTWLNIIGDLAVESNTMPGSRFHMISYDFIGKSWQNTILGGSDMETRPI